MSMAATALWLFNILFNTTGHLLLKAASLRAGMDGRRHWLRLARQVLLWIALISFAGEFLVWIAFLSQMPLSVAVMLNCFSIIGVMLGGHWLFAEEITKPRAVAVILIVLGVGLVGWGGV
jgi:drug/metabolite transporter (DMT)-like permease